MKTMNSPTGNETWPIGRAAKKGSFMSFMVSDNLMIIMLMMIMIGAPEPEPAPAHAVGIVKAKVNQLCSESHTCGEGLSCQAQKTICPGPDSHRSTCAEQRCLPVVPMVPVVPGVFSLTPTQSTPSSNAGVTAVITPEKMSFDSLPGRY